MVSFDDIKSEVEALIVDLPASVTAYTGVLVNQAIRDLQVRHNYRAMRRKHEVNTTAATHVVGTLPARWKQPNGRPWFKTQPGDHVFMEWLGDDEQEIVLHYSPDDPDDKGEPERVFIRSSEDDLNTLSLEVYPFPDGLSDWTTAPAGEYRLVLPYYRYSADLSGSQTNWFTDNARQFIVHQAAGLGFIKNWDEARGALHFQLADRFERIPKKTDAAQAMKRQYITPRADVHAPVEGSRNWRF